MSGEGARLMMRVAFCDGVGSLVCLSLLCFDLASSYFVVATWERYQLTGCWDGAVEHGPHGECFFC